jgi:hypothetical protein
MVEWVNEPFSRAGRMETMTLRNARSSTRRLSAYGLEPVETQAAHFLSRARLRRRAPAATWRAAQDGATLQARRDSLRVPIIDDKPLGLTRPSSVGGAPSGMEVTNHFAVARLFGAGATLHSQAGLEGRARITREPVQTALGRSDGLALHFRRRTGQRGAHSGSPDWPIVWQPGPGGAVNYARSAWSHGVRRERARPTMVVTPRPG